MIKTKQKMLLATNCEIFVSFISKGLSKSKNTISEMHSRLVHNMWNIQGGFNTIFNGKVNLQSFSVWVTLMLLLFLFVSFPFLNFTIIIVIIKTLKKTNKKVRKKKSLKLILFLLFNVICVFMMMVFCIDATTIRVRL